MSKSSGNFFTVREVLQKFQPEVIRFFILSSHYRSPLNYSIDNLEEAKSALNGLYIALRNISFGTRTVPLKKYEDKFNACMDDDFNTPKAISLLHELARDLNKNTDKTSREAIELVVSLRFFGAVLGLLQDEPQKFLQAKSDSSNNFLDEVSIQNLIDERVAAKSDKKYSKADQIRDHLQTLGISLEDTPQGTNWRRN
jgi:cysteinyl-tRNA synthetase